MLLVAWLMSYDRRRVPWRLVAAGLALQGVFGVLVLKTGPRAAGSSRRSALLVNRVLDFVVEGARFVFGYLRGLRAARRACRRRRACRSSPSSVLPTIIFVSSLMSVLYYLGVMQGS